MVNSLHFLTDYGTLNHTQIWYQITMNDNRLLNAVVAAKHDKFYTRGIALNIAMVLSYAFFRKIILCKYNDPFESNFFKYFVFCFTRLNLKIVSQEQLTIDNTASSYF